MPVPNSPKIRKIQIKLPYISDFCIDMSFIYKSYSSRPITCVFDINRPKSSVYSQIIQQSIKLITNDTQTTNHTQIKKETHHSNHTKTSN